MLLARDLEEPIGSDQGHDQSYLNHLDFSWVLILPVENHAQNPRTAWGHGRLARSA